MDLWPSASAEQLTFALRRGSWNEKNEMRMQTKESSAEAKGQSACVMVMMVMVMAMARVTSCQEKGRRRGRSERISCANDKGQKIQQAPPPPKQQLQKQLQLRTSDKA